jgi:hypothetical protein
MPFGDKMPDGISGNDQLKIATARAARVSYMTHDGTFELEKDVHMHDRLLASGHMSPFEHSAFAITGHWANFNGWKSYRFGLPNENRKCDLKQLLADYELSLQGTPQ